MENAYKLLQNGEIVLPRYHWKCLDKIGISVKIIFKNRPESI